MIDTTVMNAHRATYAFLRRSLAKANRDLLPLANCESKKEIKSFIFKRMNVVRAQLKREMKIVQSQLYPQ